MATYSVSQNTSFLTAASILQKVISFVYFTIIARLIGAENTGQYFFAIAFTAIFVVVADFGLNAVLIREASKYPGNSEKYLNTVFWTKIFFGVAVYGLVVISVNLLGYSDSLKHLIYLSGITMFLDNLHSAFYGCLRAAKNLKYESFSVVGSQLLTLIIGSIALFSGAPLIWLIVAYTIPSFINVLYSAYFTQRELHLHYGFFWSREVFRGFMVMAVPFALAAIIGRFYAYSDSLLMSKLLTPRELGLWSVPYKIVFAFQFIPIALSTSLYPAMSSLYITEQARVDELFQKAWRYLFIIVFPLSLGLAAVARPVLGQVFGAQYLASVPALRILLISLVFGFLSFVTGATLNAINRQNVQTILMAVVLVINVFINIFLLPIWGISGAAVAAAVSNGILCLCGYYFIGQYIRLNHRQLFKYFLTTFIPAAVMATVVYWLTLRMSFIFTIPLGIIIYIFLIFVSGAFDLATLKEIRNKIFNSRPTV